VAAVGDRTEWLVSAAVDAGDPIPIDTIPPGLVSPLDSLSGIGAGAQARFVAEANNSAQDWMIFLGTPSAGPDQVSRDTLIKSTTGAWLDLPAQSRVYSDRDAGVEGPQGDTGIAVVVEGPQGDTGWSPELAVVSDGERRVQQVADWVGGEGTKPATGDYVGVGGLVSNIANAVDIRGPVGSGNIPDPTGDDDRMLVTDSDALVYRDIDTELFLRSSILSPRHVIYADQFDRPDGDIDGQSDLLGSVYTTQRFDGGGSGAGQIGTVNSYLASLGSGLGTNVAALVPRPAGAYHRRVDMSVLGRPQENWRGWGWVAGWIDADNCVYVGGLSSTLMIRVVRDGVLNQLASINMGATTSGAIYHTHMLARWVIEIGAGGTTTNGGEDVTIGTDAFPRMITAEHADLRWVLENATHEGPYMDPKVAVSSRIDSVIAVQY